MKQFFKFMFASMLGFFLTFILIFIFLLIFFVALISSAGKDKTVTLLPKSVLVLNLDNQIIERGNDNPFEGFDFFSMKSNKPFGLKQIKESIAKAKDDKNIEGIYLELSEIPAGAATVEEIRNALLDFKKSNKFIISYSEVLTQKAYYLASVADKIYLNPEGFIDFKGLNAQIMFYKGLLEKLDVEAQIIRHGKFKSAVEPFMLDKMSESNREQTKQYLMTIWNYITENISKSRNIKVDQLNLIADSLYLRTAQDAVDYKIADKLMYKDELLAELRTKLTLGENEKIRFINISKYQKVNVKRDLNSGKGKIAVVYAQGEIVSGEGSEVIIGSERISEALRKARVDSTVKAVVLRVNSPGGSALASEVILREVILIKKVKPIVVSMGDVAASGGYYIACAANRIFAHPNTITGSIGVFGMMPNMKGLFNNKLGITVDNVKTNAQSDYGDLYRPMTKQERYIIQGSVENVYKTFISHVSKGRNMTIQKVDSIGQGRVWSGVDALRLGLIDEYGGIDEAIAYAAKLAKIEKYKVIHLPKQKEPFQQLMEDISGETNPYTKLRQEFGEYFMVFDYIRQINNMKGVQARMPFEIIVY